MSPSSSHIWEKQLIALREQSYIGAITYANLFRSFRQIAQFISKLSLVNILLYINYANNKPTGRIKYALF